MTQIDSLILQLNKQMDAKASTVALNRSNIEAAMHGKASHLAEKVNRTLLWEAGSIVVLLGIVGILLVVNQHPFLQLISGVVVFICLAMGGVYFWSYRSIKLLLRFEVDTVSMLKGLITAVKKLMKIYTGMVAVSMAVGFVVGGLYAVFESVNKDGIATAPMPEALTAWYAVPASMVMILVAWWFTKWYIRRLYGKPLQALENCLKEITDEK